MQASFETDYEGPLLKKDRVDSLADLFAIPKKWGGMKSYVEFDASLPETTGKTYELKPLALCKMPGEIQATKAEHGTVLAHWKPVATGAEAQEFLKSLPGYDDPDKPYLKKDAAGFFYWGAGEVAPDTNAAPNYTQIAAVSFAENVPSYQINLADYFQDPDGDALVYSVQSLGTNPTLISYEDMAGGSTLTLYPNAAGTTNLTVRATDPAGQYAQQTFAVTVEPRGDTYAESGYVINGYSD